MLTEPARNVRPTGPATASRRRIGRRGSAILAAMAAVTVAADTQAQERTARSANEFLSLFAQDGGFIIHEDFYSAGDEPGSSDLNRLHGEARRVTEVLSRAAHGGGAEGCVSIFRGDSANGIVSAVEWADSASVTPVRWDTPRSYDTRSYYPFVVVHFRTSEPSIRTYVAFYPRRESDLDRLSEALQFLHQNCSALTATGF